MQTIIKFLRYFSMGKKLTDAEKLLRRANNHNWDEGYWVVEEIIENEHCDKGTALFIYWRSRPEWFRQYIEYSDVPDYEQEGYLFTKFVEQRFAQITKDEIIYDPFEAEEVGLYKNNITYKSELPEIMYKKTSGTIHYKKVLEKYIRNPKIIKN
jgi:hypothetical protein